MVIAVSDIDKRRKTKKFLFPFLDSINEDTILAKEKQTESLKRHTFDDQGILVSFSFKAFLFCICDFPI